MLLRIEDMDFVDTEADILAVDTALGSLAADTGADSPADNLVDKRQDLAADKEEDSRTEKPQGPGDTSDNRADMVVVGTPAGRLPGHAADTGIREAVDMGPDSRDRDSPVAESVDCACLDRSPAAGIPEQRQVGSSGSVRSRLERLDQLARLHLACLTPLPICQVFQVFLEFLFPKESVYRKRLILVLAVAYLVASRVVRVRYARRCACFDLSADPSFCRDLASSSCLSVRRTLAFLRQAVTKI